MQKFQTLPLPQLRELFADILSLHDHIAERLKAEGKHEEYKERLAIKERQMFLQRSFIAQRERQR